MNGTFIVLEGPDGSGTTTHAGLLADRLSARGAECLLTWEPTDGPIGLSIRESLKKGGLPASALQLLFCADRAWHIENVIQPALEQGKIIICDRYALSTLVYGVALGLDGSWLETLNNKFIQPDVQMVLLPPYEATFERVGLRATKDILEEETLMKKVYDAYAYEAKRQGLIVIDTSAELNSVAGRIESIVMKIIPGNQQ